MGDGLVERASIGTTAVLTVADLAARWGCSAETVFEMVRTRKVPYFQVGKPRRLDQRGPKDLRFRPEAIAAWEAAQEAVWTTKEAIAADGNKQAAVAAANGWEDHGHIRAPIASSPRSRRLAREAAGAPGDRTSARE